MSPRVLKQALPDERLTQQKLDIFFGPVPCRQCLEEHHDLLHGVSFHAFLSVPHNAAYLEIHLHELVGPLDQECSAHVEVESREALLLGLRWLSA